MSKKLNVQKIKLLGQDYLVKSSETSDMIKIAEYVNAKMEEVIKSGIDRNSQQLRVAIFTCLEIAGELFLYKNQNKHILSQYKNKSKLLIELIDEKLENINK